MQRTKVQRISIIYHYFAHYREPVLGNLRKRIYSKAKLDLVSGEKSNIDSLTTINQDVLSRLCDQNIGLKNIWLGPFLWQKGLVRYISRSDSTDIIFLGQINFLSTWIAVFLCRLLRKRVSFWTHGVYGNESVFKFKLRFFFYNLADHVFLYGNHAKNILINQGFPEHKLHVIYNSLDYELQLKFRLTLLNDKIQSPFTNNQPYIIFVGRLTEVKRLDVLLRSIHLLRCSSLGEVRCLIVGDGPSKDELNALSKELEIEHLINFYGSCHDESILSELIYNADICVSPGNVGLTAMHSLVYGTPVITHASKEWQMPEFEAITPGRTGDFFERDNFEDLADKICRWLEKSSSDRTNIRDDCFKVIDGFYNPDYQIDTIFDAIGLK